MLRVFALTLLVVFAGPALAQSTQDRLVADLQAEGYTRISMSRTLLGRVQIVAESDTHKREIVLNPRTGVILRDYLVLLGLEGRDDDSSIEEGSESESSPGGGESPDDGEDENDDDDDHDDDDDDYDDDDD